MDVFWILAGAAFFVVSGGLVSLFDALNREA
jgi:hypothetical protein